ncbi:MAG: hypothetical protein QNJ87_01880 [Gammaproteobacteria bacterium]|nr:hypothetical protein [Gammaproteobacteria bacterium]MDJ0870498.1 hypothetical protein [Gammaproteobacteria bacterium]
MAYTIPIPESALHTLLLQQLPRFVEGPEIGFVSGRVIVEGRLRKLGMAFRFVLEFEPIASAPDDSDNALDWRIRNVRPFLVRWALRSEVRQRSARAGERTRLPSTVRLHLDTLLEGLPAWRRLPVAVRSNLRLQHWWMPNDGRGVFLVFARKSTASAPVLPKSESRLAPRENCPDGASKTSPMS